MKIVIIIAGLLMISGSIAVIYQKSLKSAIIIFGMISLIASILFVIMKAYDVAITEASIGAVLTLALYFFTLKRLKEDGYKEGRHVGTTSDNHE